MKKEINELLDGEEVWWQQRSRVRWLGEGDHNTKYFHNHASVRQRKNTISGLWNENGIWCESKENVAATAISYFENIYTTTNLTRIAEVVSLILAKVSGEMNDSLVRNFSIEEVRVALQQMHPTRAPGLDGMSAIFYQKYWNIVGSNVTSMVLNVLNLDNPMTELNKTNITLVPKVKQPTRMKDFWPISLSNVAYKLISKVLANCLKVVLPQLISENQSAFLSECLLTRKADHR